MKIEMDELESARTSGRSVTYVRKNFYRLGTPRLEAKGKSHPKAQRHKAEEKNWNSRNRLPKS
jgi:hypothetical protein